MAVLFKHIESAQTDIYTPRSRILSLVLLFFMLLPFLLAASTRAVPRGNDTVNLILWIILIFSGLSWLFVILDNFSLRMKISVARAGGKAVTKSGNFLLGDYKVEISK